MSTAATTAAELLQQHQQRYQHYAAGLAATTAALQRLQHTDRDDVGGIVPSTLQAPHTVQQSSRPGQVRKMLPHHQTCLIHLR